MGGGFEEMATEQDDAAVRRSPAEPRQSPDQREGDQSEDSRGEQTGARGGSNPSPAVAPAPLPPSAETNEATKKRPRSGITAMPQSPSPANKGVVEDLGGSVTKQQRMEMLAQKEALHHVEMAWRAQQRLVQRCLGLRLFGGSQSTNEDDDVGGGGGVRGNDVVDEKSNGKS